jgi:hypothetical protein
MLSDPMSESERIWGGCRKAAPHPPNAPMKASRAAGGAAAPVRTGRFRQGAALGSAGTPGMMLFGSLNQQRAVCPRERMNSPLERRKVRLRGLLPRVPRAENALEPAAHLAADAQVFRTPHTAGPPSPRRRTL